MKHFGGLSVFFLMTWGYIHPTYLLFSIANSWEVLHAATAHSVEMEIPPQQYSHEQEWHQAHPQGSFWKSNSCFSPKSAIRRNPSKMSKKCCGFKHGIIQNTSPFCALCELHQKKSIFNNSRHLCKHRPKTDGKSPLQFNTPWFRES